MIEKSISYWVGIIEMADVLIYEYSGTSKLHRRMRELATARRKEALEKIAALDAKPSWSVVAVEEIIAEEENEANDKHES